MTVQQGQQNTSVIDGASQTPGSGGISEEEQRLLNKEKEIERKQNDLELQREKLDELKTTVLQDVKSQQQAATQQKPFNEEEVLQEFIKTEGLDDLITTDEDGNQKFDTMKLARTMLRTSATYVDSAMNQQVNPEIEKLKKSALVQSMMNKDPMAEEYIKVANEELSDLSCSMERKIEVAKQLVEGRVRTAQPQEPGGYGYSQEELGQQGQTQPVPAAVYPRQGKPNMARTSSSNAGPGGSTRLTPLQRQVMADAGLTEQQYREMQKQSGG